MSLPLQPCGSFNILTFPMKELNGGETNLVHAVDLIQNFQGDINFSDLSTSYKLACERKDLQYLPAPFGLKVEVPKETTIQIVIIKNSEGEITILKHLAFPGKIKATFFKQLIYGEGFRSVWMQPSPKGGRKILQNLGGRIFKCFELTSQASRKGPKPDSSFEEKDDDDIDAGFDHILKMGPRSSCEMAQLRWQTKELRNKSSPIFGWPVALVSQALRNLAADGALARKEHHWPLPLTPKYFRAEVLKALEAIWDFDQASLVMLGEPGGGKSPLGRSVLFAQCRHNLERFQVQGQPCIRCTPELDFLRGEPGSVLMGDFLDDTALNLLSMKLVKAFLDVGLYESMAWARWGASKWVQNEPRAVADNTYEDSIPLPPDYVLEINFTDFYDMIKKAFIDQATRTHMDAILKRAAFLVNSKTHLYYRRAGINEDKVPRVALSSDGFLTADGKKVYGEYKAGQKETPEDFMEEVRKEQEWVSIIMNKRFEERRMSKQEARDRKHLREALFGDKPKEESALETLQAHEEERVAIKREKEEVTMNHVFKKARVWSRELASSSIVIDLDPDSEEETRAPKHDANPECAHEDEDPFNHGFATYQEG